MKLIINIVKKENKLVLHEHYKLGSPIYLSISHMLVRSSSNELFLSLYKWNNFLFISLLGLRIGTFVIEKNFWNFFCNLFIL